MPVSPSVMIFSIHSSFFATTGMPPAIASAKVSPCVSETDALQKTVEEVIAANPQSVADYKAGKQKAIGFLVGQTMKVMKGKANPTAVNEILVKLLNE